MKALFLRGSTNIAAATFLLVALWSLKTRAFVNLPGIGPEKYESFGRIPEQCLTVSLILGTVLALFGLKRLAILLTGISLGFLSSTLATYWQQIEELKAEAVAASDPASQEMIQTMLAESHTSPGFWILSLALVAATIVILIPIGKSPKTIAGDGAA